MEESLQFAYFSSLPSNWTKDGRTTTKWSLEPAVLAAKNTISSLFKPSKETICKKLVSRTYIKYLHDWNSFIAFNAGVDKYRECFRFDIFRNAIWPEKGCLIVWNPNFWSKTFYPENGQVHKGFRSVYLTLIKSMDMHFVMTSPPIQKRTAWQQN
jgi:hypothetical protein